MKWEYKMVEFNFGSNNIDFAELGDEGWELCATLPYWAAQRVQFIFKRPKE